MTRAEFKARRLKHDRIKQILDTSEMLILVLALTWGAQLMMAFASDRLGVPRPAGSFPFVWMPFRGALLMAVTVFHAVCIVANNVVWRRRAIGAEVLFFLYAALSIMGRHGEEPGMATALVLVVFGSLNFFSLMRPVE